MRVCPKCGHIDPPYWKHCRWSYYIDDCAFENFKIMHPDLAIELLKKRMVDDEYYIYRMQKKLRGAPQWVQRKAKIDVTIGWKDLVERFPHLPKLKKLKYIIGHPAKGERYCDFLSDWSKHHPNQKKLFEDYKLE